MVDMIPCSECGEMIPFVSYSDHEQECVGRQLTKCHQCKLLYPTFLIEEHLNVCETFNEESPQKVTNLPKAPEEDYDSDFEDIEADEEMDVMIM